MARPKDGSGERPADERLANALWEALAEKPLREVTVAELCRRAGINKTTFYYHFRSLDELLQHVEDAYEEENFPALLVDAALEGELAGREDDLVEQFRPLVDHARLLLGPGGDPSFPRKVQDAMFAHWCDRLGVAQDDLDPYDALLLRHAMGGTASVLANAGEDPDYALLLKVVFDTMLPHVDRMMQRYGASGAE